MDVCGAIGDCDGCGTDKNTGEHQCPYVKVMGEKAGEDTEDAGHAARHAERPRSLLVRAVKVVHEFT